MADQPLPIVPYLKLPESGDPYLEGFKCSECGAITLKARTACGGCGARDSQQPYRLSNKGELHVFSITHRSFPGIEVPFVSAIADLDGGGTVKSNLIDIDPDPEKIKSGMRVEVVYKIAPRKDAEGNEYMMFYLRPEAA
jgi:uncharacterized OB-fold protein